MSGEIPGITIYGATLFADAVEVVDGVYFDPVYLPAEMVDDLITKGALTAGLLNNVNVRPAVSEWPARWKFMKEQ